MRPRSIMSAPIHCSCELCLLCVILRVWQNADTAVPLKAGGGVGVTLRTYVGSDQRKQR